MKPDLERGAHFLLVWHIAVSKTSAFLGNVLNCSGQDWRNEENKPCWSAATMSGAWGGIFLVSGTEG